MNATQRKAIVAAVDALNCLAKFAMGRNPYPTDDDARFDAQATSARLQDVFPEAFLGTEKVEQYVEYVTGIHDVPLGPARPESVIGRNETVEQAADRLIRGRGPEALNTASSNCMWADPSDPARVFWNDVFQVLRSR